MPHVHVAMLLVAVLALALELECRVSDAVLLQFITNFVLDLVRVAVCYHVHSGIIALPVHAPNVNMVHAKHTGDLA